MTMPIIRDIQYLYVGIAEWVYAYLLFERIGEFLVYCMSKTSQGAKDDAEKENNN